MEGGTWGCTYAGFYEQWKFYSCLLEEVILESKNLFVLLVGMQNVSSYLERKNIKRKVSMLIHSIDKCIITKKKF